MTSPPRVFFVLAFALCRAAFGVIPAAACRLQDNS